jgi:hypothetical protein
LHYLAVRQGDQERSQQQLRADETLSMIGVEQGMDHYERLPFNANAARFNPLRTIGDEEETSDSSNGSAANVDIPAAATRGG